MMTIKYGIILSLLLILSLLSPPVEGLIIVEETKEELFLFTEKEDLEGYSFWSSYEVKYIEGEYRSIAYLQSYYLEGAVLPHSYLMAVIVDLHEGR